MFVWDIVFAVLVGILITAILSLGFRGTRTMAGMLALFFVVFLMAWAGGVWLVPVGPMLGGVRVFPFLMVAVIAALLIAASTPPWYRPRTRGEALRQAEAEENAERLFNAFFWVLILCLIGAIVAGYFLPRRLA
ncbi:MAG: hypothetical protein GF418_12850 [Chitinivibrionales bacterium]|nr:hypothetical protein [Chitinivibrionales bacterium]MBD3396507.1 hypothetical protein [Chitinivibrionales bacterium]